MTRRGLVRKDRAGNRRGAIGTAAGALLSLAVLAVGAASASAAPQPLSMEFTEARANVGVQLSDYLLFGPPPAELEATYDPATGEITSGELTVPDFETHIVEPVDADVTIEFRIGEVTGDYNQDTGALTLRGMAGGLMTANSGHCDVEVVGELTLSTAGSTGTPLEGDAAPRWGSPFAHGLGGGGSIAGQWNDMTATPGTEPGDETVCETAGAQIGGRGGIWLFQADIVDPAAPELHSTNPASPSQSGNVRIVGSAEAGSTVRVYDNATCSGDPVATGTAAELAAPGLAVTVAEGATATFAATATDAAGNMSDCSAPIGYQRLKPPPANDDPKPPVKPDPPKPRPCVVPKLAGKTLPQARKALKRANCKVGKVTRTKRAKQLKRLQRSGGKRVVLVVKSFSPRRGARPANRKVSLKLGPKPSKAGGRRR